MSRDGKFGTFGGVYTPSLLTILGVIMYLRLPWVVGNAGLAQALGIILVAHVISVSTGLSISSIATDKAVGAGGPYYIISRSLGLPIGGALGLALCVGLAFSISLYVIGFSESLLTYFKLGATVQNIRICGTIAIIALTIVTFISTALAIKTQYFILAAIALSLVSILLGVFAGDPGPPHIAPHAEARPLPELFAIFFPAVTGFTAGVNMSGDLRSPKDSIPRGTLLAIATGFVVYVGLAVLLGLRVDPDSLVNDSELLINVSYSGPLVVAGIWAATLSSALGSILGSPRILQAVAADGIAPRFFARGYGPTQEPRNALLLSFVIGEAGILIGELDAIARIVSMIFLTMYCVLNLSCALESWANPDFRPEFRIPKSISIAGAVTSLVVMIQLDLAAMAGALALMGLLFFHLKRRQLQLESGDTWEGFWATLVRAGLHRLSTGARLERHWKPNVLAFDAGARDEGGGDRHRELAESLVGGAGMLTHIEVGKARPPAEAQPARGRRTPEGAPPIGIFRRVIAAGPDPDASIRDFCRFHGFSGIEPNTVLLRWADYAEDPARLSKLLSEIAELDFNELVLAHGQAPERERKQRIDIWWRDQGGNLPLSLSLARFITGSPDWENADLRFVLLSENPGNTDVLRSKTRRYLMRMRVEATVKVISASMSIKGYEDWVRDESGDADLVLLPLSDSPSEADMHFLTRMARLLPDLREVLLLRASSSFEEVLSAGHGARDSLLPGPAGGEESFALPALELPAPPALRELATALAAGYERALAGLDEHCLARVHSQNIELVRRVRDALERQFAALEKGLSGANARRRRQLLNRFASSFVIDAQALIEEHLRDGLADQQATIEGRIDAFLDEEARLTHDPRHSVLVEREIEDLASHPDDPPKVRRWKRRKRWSARLLRRRPRYRLRVGSLERYYFDRAKRVILQPAVAQLITESHQLAVHLGKALCSSRAGTNAVIGEALEEAAPEEMLAELKQRALEPFDQLIERTRSRVLHRRRDLIARGHALLGEFAADIDRLDAARLARRERKLPRDAAVLRARFRELPGRFGSLGTSLYERADVGLTVAAFHHRLSAIVQRQKEAAVMQLRNGALRTCRELQASLEALWTAVEAAPLDALKVPKLVADEGERLAPKEFVAALAAEVRPALEDLPESRTLLLDGVVDTLEEGADADPQTADVAVRSLAQFLVESELIAGVAEQLDPAPELEGRALIVARDVTRLVAFQLAEVRALALADAKERTDHVRPALDSGLERISAEIESLLGLVQRVEERFDAQLPKVIEGSEAYRLSEAGSRLGQHRRLRQGKIAVSGAQGYLRSVQAALRKTAVSMLYRGSAGVLLARELRARDGGSASLVERLRALVRSNTPQPAVVDALPFYYRQVFLGQALNESFWVGRDKELAQARRAVQSHRDGQSGVLLVVGRPGSGKTALCQRIAHKALDPKTVHWVQPPAGGSTELSVFREALRTATGDPGSATTCDELLERLPDNATLVLDDVELWWERDENGFAVIDELLRLIARHGHRTLFVLGMGHHAFRLLSALRRLSDRALAVIECMPMPARDLGSILTLRHGSTGLKFELAGRQEDQLSTFQLARLFSRHFSYSGGSVGGALRAWITHVERVRDGVISLRPPTRPHADPLDELRGSWRALLLELVLHRRLTPSRLTRLSGLTAQQVEDDVDALERTGLVTRSRHGLYEINPFVRELLTSHFEERGLLPA